MIGRKEEISAIQDCLESNRPEFLVVYGRRRVGKTYLVKEFFNNEAIFHVNRIAGRDSNHRDSCIDAFARLAEGQRQGTSHLMRQ